MPLSLVQTIPPAIEPISVLELKRFLRIDHDAEDLDLPPLISAARDDVEMYLRRQLLPATWALSLDTWQDPIRLPRPPTLAVLSVQYYDAGGVLQPMDAAGYYVDIVSQPARLCLASTLSVPPLQEDRLNAITILYQAGYASTTHIPPSIRHGIKLLCGDLYEHRESRLDVGSGVARVEDNPTLVRMLYKYRVVDL
jgi:uncharacterized phiE125 gp8 family phage protein